MRTRIGAALGVASLVASAGVVASQSTANAEPEAHQVKYSVTTNAPYDFELFYLTAQPPNKAAYNADAYSFVKREKVSLAPGTPWVFETTLADPQWAILTVSSTTRGTVGAPDAHCDITVDGQVAVQQDAPYSPMCQLGQW
ncbi:MAG: hypothetical protein ABW001_13200 [Mycobacterium sp.]